MANDNSQVDMPVVATTTPVREAPANNSVSLADAALKNASSQPPLSGQDKINQMSADAQDNTDAAARALAGFSTQMTSAYQGLKQTASSAADALIASKTTEGLAQLQAQKAKLEQANVLGTNPDAASFALNYIAAQYKKNNALAQKFSDNIADAMDPANIMDHPGTYLKNLLLFDFNQAGQQSAEAASRRSYQQYMGLNQMTQEFAQTQNAIAQTMTTESVAQNAQVAAVQLNMQAQNAQIEQLRSNSDMLMKSLTLQNEPLQIERARQASELQAQHLALARQQAAKSMEMLQLQIARERIAESREARQDQKFKEAEQADQDIVDTVNNAAALRGVPMRFNSVKDIQLASKNPILKEKIDMLYNAGSIDKYYKTNNTGVPTVSIGSNPSEALGMVTDLGAKTVPGQAPIFSLINDTNKQLSVGQPAPKSAADVRNYNDKLDATVRETAARQYKDISTGQGNIYSAPPLSTFLSDDSFKAGAPFLSSQVFKTDKDLGTQEINWKGTMQQVVAGIRDKTITVDQADSELKFLAAKVMSTNNALRQYGATAGLPPMKNVNIPVWAGGPLTRMFTGAEGTLDLADDTKRRAYLNSQMASWIQPEYIQQAVKNIPPQQLKQMQQSGAQ